MPVRWLKPSRILTVENYTHFEAFRPSEVLGGGICTPLAPREFSMHRAILPLEDGLLVLQRSFARKMEANVGIDHGIGLVIPLAFHSIANGREIDGSMIGVVRGKVPTKVMEHHPNTYLMMRFNSDMRHRGWANFDNGLEFFRLHDAPMQHLRAAILDMFCLAADCNDPRQFESLNRPIQETLLASLDDALAPTETSGPRRGSYDRHRKLVARLDEVVATLGGTPLYSDELASALGVSVRTLQTAAQVVHGLSLHHYLRLKRLWATRVQLMSGSPSLTIKAAALANGFWHMGEFSTSYKVAFGEMPSETLAQSRRPPRVVVPEAPIRAISRAQPPSDAHCR